MEHFAPNVERQSLLAVLGANVEPCTRNVEYFAPNVERETLLAVPRVKVEPVHLKVERSDLNVEPRFGNVEHFILM